MPWLTRYGTSHADRHARTLRERKAAQHAAAVARRRKAKRGGPR